ncbi:hypothetical protein [Pseudomonas serbica]|uniref:hypothetical protein n=1 Tax=Pseudomonas serbica TaxID=2965074 RepID=UPI00237B2147|nr:hypothetical protein [Pseudomonas serbica]
MEPLSKSDVSAVYPPRYELNQETFSIAQGLIRDLWNERRLEHGLPPTDDRSSSCKFASLIARELFGGRLAGNEMHVFVLRDGAVLDLNEEQTDVLLLAEQAHHEIPKCIQHRDYRASLGTCMPRVRHWIKVAEERMPATARLDRALVVGLDECEALII